MDSKEHTFILSLTTSAVGMNESRVDDAERRSLIELIESSKGMATAGLAI